MEIQTKTIIIKKIKIKINYINIKHLTQILFNNMYLFDELNWIQVWPNQCYEWKIIGMSK